ncbi:hypothetical protein JMA_26670 [Jeotgalibacillus malaysiensis]|uniref:Uncharacterized protein n=1 Tax=Jeotgalibacillus malaysiensis TaxID=1508404 RepID=A0A0B5AVF9_9BACL|nr:hypothetical protein JMA_26670 [Jeotgalibacillus malaysiensis]
MYILHRKNNGTHEVLKDSLNRAFRFFVNQQEASQLSRKLNRYTQKEKQWRVKKINL